MNGPEVDLTLEMKVLQAENARLVALLKSHGIEWRVPPQPVAVAVQEPELSRLSTAEKVALFRRLFRRRTDVYPVRWGQQSHTQGWLRPHAHAVNGASMLTSTSRLVRGTGRCCCQPGKGRIRQYRSTPFLMVPAR